MSHSHSIEEAVKALGQGRIIAYPTETVWGLGVDPGQPEALNRLLKAKGRSAGKGLIVLINRQQWLSRLVAEVSPLSQKLMDLYWPGAVTLLLPARPSLSPVLTGGGSLVAVRHSPLPLVEALLDRWQHPLVSTSANLSGEPAVSSAEELKKCFGAQVAVVLEESQWQPARAASTVVEPVAEGRLRIHRQGAVRISPLPGVTVEGLS